MLMLARALGFRLAARPAAYDPRLAGKGLVFPRFSTPIRAARRGASDAAWPVSGIGLDAMYPYGYCPPMYTVRQTEAFVAWLDALTDLRAQVRIAARLRQAEAGSLGDWQPVDGEVSEMRVHYGPGYRLYFVRRGRVIVVLLNGGDKSTQKRDIRRALKLAEQVGDDP